MLEYGERKEGYWTSDKFMTQIEKAAKIAEAKYTKDDGWRVVWIFNQSSCHVAMPDDALDAPNMNVNPGGKQHVMRDGLWEWKDSKDELCIGCSQGIEESPRGEGN